MNYEYVLNCFPDSFKRLIETTIIEKNIKSTIEEIRIRVNLPVIIKTSYEEIVLKYIVTIDDTTKILQKICENSLYAYQKQISNGYITIRGGNRVGVVGSGVIKDDEIVNLNYISGMNFRMSRQVFGCSDSVIEDIINREKNSIYNTLIISSPGMGKTTLLKDIIKKVSDGISGFKGLTISVIDERGEIAAMYKGIAQNDLGIRTDVLDNVPKSIGMKMAIRSMAPQIIVADEIGSQYDVESIKYAVRCGVKGIFTAHAGSMEELKQNPELKVLVNEKFFEKVILINGRNRKQN